MVETFDKETKVRMQVVSADSDYVASRLLFMVGILPSAGRLANHVIESYAKAFLWSISRGDIVKMIRDWRGNPTHDSNKILQLICKENLLVGLDAIVSKHGNVMENFHAAYCMRYMDIFEKEVTSKLCADLGVIDVGTLDEVVSVLRKAIVLQEPSWIETPLTKILKGKAGDLGKNEREYLTRGNKYFIVKN